jgi:NAD(P)-dependent dehydrogenase (short-subunit alcohol dehydrogenase family)
MGDRLRDKVAVISGTGDGQGRTGALRFAAEGAKIVGCDIDQGKAAETVRLVRDAGGEVDCLYLDWRRKRVYRQPRPVHQLCHADYTAMTAEPDGEGALRR